MFFVFILYQISLVIMDVCFFCHFVKWNERLSISHLDRGLSILGLFAALPRWMANGFIWMKGLCPDSVQQKTESSLGSQCICVPITPHGISHMCWWKMVSSEHSRGSSSHLFSHLRDLGFTILQTAGARDSLCHCAHANVFFKQRVFSMINESELSALQPLCDFS